MLDGLTLDQLRTFIAAAEEGSFSAAGRKLGRAQSVVSQTLANLEAQLGVKLFDRSARYPRLTDEGRALLLDARAVADGMADFKAHAGTLREGLEPEVAAVIDVMYPMAALTRALGLFRANYPRTTLRLYVEVLGAVIEAVLERRCRIGVVGSLPLIPPEAQSQALLEVAEDIRDGRLVKLRIEGKPARAQVMPMHAVWRKDAPPGPAGRALVEWLTA